MKKIIIFLVSFIFFLSGCKNATDSPTKYVPKDDETVEIDDSNCMKSVISDKYMFVGEIYISPTTPVIDLEIPYLFDGWSTDEFKSVEGINIDDLHIEIIEKGSRNISFNSHPNSKFKILLMSIYTTSNVDFSNVERKINKINISSEFQDYYIEVDITIKLMNNFNVPGVAPCTYDELYNVYGCQEETKKCIVELPVYFDADYSSLNIKQIYFEGNTLKISSNSKLFFYQGNVKKYIEVSDFSNMTYELHNEDMYLELIVEPMLDNYYICDTLMLNYSIDNTSDIQSVYIGLVQCCNLEV